MELFNTIHHEALTEKAKKLYREEREAHKILNGWFLAKEIAADAGDACTETHPELRAAAELEAIIRENFDLRPAGIIQMLDLRRPIYKQTAAYGHFGRNDLDLPWEATDKVELLKQYL